MAGIKDLDTLLHSMKPTTVEGDFVFCTVPNKQFSALKIMPTLMFIEDEGITLIVEKKIADKHSLRYEGVWTMITLTVHSDLAAVGFLAAITKRLAEEGISVNVVSAYYHDHLFVPIQKGGKTLKVLEDMSSSK
jgi:uncharacterized protein